MAKRARSGVTKVAPKEVASAPKGRRTTEKVSARTASKNSIHGNAVHGKTTKKLPPPPPVATFRVRELDPLQKCGAGTSVQRLFRIDETTAGVVRPHLVFFDRHGLYCEHGRDCPAVSHARSVMAHDDPQHSGPTHNGRMRA